jgi:hypothetical protein
MARTLRLDALARNGLTQSRKVAKENSNLDLPEIFIGTTKSPPSKRSIQSVAFRKRRMAAEFRKEGFPELCRAVEQERFSLNQVFDLID